MGTSHIFVQFTISHNYLAFTCAYRNHAFLRYSHSASSHMGLTRDLVDGHCFLLVSVRWRWFGLQSACQLRTKTQPVRAFSGLPSRLLAASWSMNPRPTQSAPGSTFPLRLRRLRHRGRACSSRDRLASVAFLTRVFWKVSRRVSMLSPCVDDLVLRTWPMMGLARRGSMRIAQPRVFYNGNPALPGQFDEACEDL